MNLDLRVPMGLMFTLVGIVLTAEGIATRGSAMYGQSAGVNVNLDWGVVMLVFGVFMYLHGRRGQKRSAQLPPQEIEGTSRPLSNRGH